MIREAVHIISDHPLTGVGTGSMTEYTRDKGSAVRHPHNSILYMGVSHGVPGIIACLWLFWVMLRQSWEKRDKAIGYYVFSSGLIVILSGFFDTQILNTGTLIFFTLTYGLLNHLQSNETID